MRRYFAYSIILIFFLAMIVYGYNKFVQPILPYHINDMTESMGTPVIVVIGVVSGFRDVIGFVRELNEKREETKATPNLSTQSPNLITRKNRKSNFIIQIALGLLIPPITCLFTLIFYLTRYLLTGAVGVSGVSEGVIIIIGLFGIIALSVIFFFAGIIQLGEATYHSVKRFNLQDTLGTLRGKLTKYQQEYPNWRVAVGKLPKAINSYSKTAMPDFKERLIAIGLSLFIPGVGLIYRDRIGLGILSFCFTVVGYFAEILPGILLHLLVIIVSGMIDRPQKPAVDRPPLTIGQANSENTPK